MEHTKQQTCILWTHPCTWHSESKFQCNESPNLTSFCSMSFHFNSDGIPSWSNKWCKAINDKNLTVWALTYQVGMMESVQQMAPIGLLQPPLTFLVPPGKHLKMVEKEGALDGGCEKLSTANKIWLHTAGKDLYGPLWTYFGHWSNDHIPTNLTHSFCYMPFW